MTMKILQIAIPFVWFGLVAGLSFLEAPLKFHAPGITLPLGLGIGRLVFYALNKIEIVLALSLIVTFWFVRPKGKPAVVTAAIVLFILFLQTIWLLPVLDVRAEQVIAGTAEPGSSAHIIYIILEALKLLALLVLGAAFARTHLTVE